MKTVTIGMIGAGRGTQLHCMGYGKVSGLFVRLKSIYDCSVERMTEAKVRYGFEETVPSLEAVLRDLEIDVIDICTPPYTHKDMIIQALNHGKHVICEKPLCGFFGDGNTDKKVMYETVLRDLDELDEAIKKSGKTFMYAENFIYAPSIVKAAEIIKAKGSKILYAKGEESLAGSSSAVAGYWEKSGGGTLMRVGSHPLGAIIWLKSNLNGARVTRVVSDITTVSSGLSHTSSIY